MAVFVDSFVVECHSAQFIPTQLHWQCFHLCKDANKASLTTLAPLS